MTLELSEQDLGLIRGELEQDGRTGPFKRADYARWVEGAVQGRLTRAWDEKNRREREG